MASWGDPEWMPLYDATGNLSMQPTTPAAPGGLEGLYATLKGWLGGAGGAAGAAGAPVGAGGAAGAAGAPAAAGGAAGGGAGPDWKALGAQGLGMVRAAGAGGAGAAPMQPPGASAYRPGAGAAGALEQLAEMQRKRRAGMRTAYMGGASAFGGAEGGADRGGGLLG